MAPPHFCQLMTGQVGKVRYIQNKGAICLTENQASYVYKKVEQEVVSILKQ